MSSDFPHACNIINIINTIGSAAARHTTKEDSVAPRRASHDRSVTGRRRTLATPGRRVRSDRKFETLHVPAGKSELLGRSGLAG